MPPKMRQTNTVYKLNCLSCPTTYVGETKRELRERMYNHKTSTTSLAFLHSHENDHEFDYKNIEILDQRVRVEQTRHFRNAVHQ